MNIPRGLVKTFAQLTSFKANYKVESSSAAERIDSNHANTKISVIDLKPRAKSLRTRSNESLLAAQLCFDNQLHDASIVASWFAVKQIITAAIYHQHLVNGTEPQANLSNELTSVMFKRLMHLNNAWLIYKHLAPGIDMLRDRMKAATDGDPSWHLNSDAAYSSLCTAKEACEAILQIAQFEWESNGSDDSTNRSTSLKD